MTKHKLKFHLLVLVGSIMTGMLTAPAMRAGSDKEAIERTIEKLNQVKPELRNELGAHLYTFEKLILSFVSKSNTEGFPTHRARIGNAIKDFKETLTKYGCCAAKRLRDDLDALVCTLGNHIGQTSGINLGIDLFAHKHLLPDSVCSSCGPFELPARLSYRLNCK